MNSMFSDDFSDGAMTCDGVPAPVFTLPTSDRYVVRSVGRFGALPDSVIVSACQSEEA